MTPHAPRIPHDAGRIPNRLLLWLIWITLVTIPLWEGPKNIGIGLVLLALLRMMGKKIPVQVGPFRWLGLLVAVAFISSVSAISPLEGFKGTIDYLRVFIFGIAVMNAVRDRRAAHITLAVIAGTSAASAWWALGRVWLGYGVESYQRSGLSVLSLGFSNHTATFMALALLAALTLTKMPGWYRWIGVLAALPIALALAKTDSRGGWLAALVMMGYFLLTLPSKRMVCWTLVLVMVLLTLVVDEHSVGELLSIYRLHFTQMEVPGQSPITWRLNLWRGCGAAIAERPLLGVGPKNFRYLDPERYLRPWQYTDHAHNFLVNIAVEVGLAGLVIFIIWLARLVQATFAGERMYRVLAQSAIIVLAVAGMATTTFHTEGALLFVALVGIHLGLKNAEEDKSPGHQVT